MEQTSSFSNQFQLNKVLFTIISQSVLEEELQSPLVPEISPFSVLRKSQRAFTYSSKIKTQQQKQLKIQNQSDSLFKEKKDYLLKKYSVYQPQRQTCLQPQIQNNLRKKQMPAASQMLSLDDQIRLKKLSRHKNQILCLNKKQRKYQFLKENFLQEWKKQNQWQGLQQKQLKGRSFLTFQEIEQKEKKIQLEIHNLILQIQKEQNQKQQKICNDYFPASQTQNKEQEAQKLKVVYLINKNLSVVIYVIVVLMFYFIFTLTNLI